MGIPVKSGPDTKPEFFNMFLETPGLRYKAASSYRFRHRTSTHPIRHGKGSYRGFVLRHKTLL